MRMKVSNYIAQKLVDEGITQVFSVTGGGAMHLNDALGHQKGLPVYITTTNRPALLQRRATPGSTTRSRRSALLQALAGPTPLPEW